LINRSGAGACTILIRAGPAGVFGTMGDNHPELRRDDVEPLRGLLADHMHRRAAAGAIGVFRRNPSICGRCPGSAPRLARRLSQRARAPAGSFLSVGRRITGNRLLDVLERELQLFGIELLRASAELRALQLTQAIHLRQRLIALGDSGVPLRPCRSWARRAATTPEITIRSRP